MTSIAEIEKYLMKLLQREICISIDTKVLKKGKLLLFNIKDFFCIFTLLINNKTITYELSYPFGVSQQGSSIIFDYTLDTFCCKSEEIQQHVSMLNIKKPSKFYNKKVTLTVI